MSERTIPVYVDQLVYDCDDCDDGQLVFTGLSDITGGEQAFQHRCNECESTFTLDKAYPSIAYAPVHDEENNVVPCDIDFEKIDSIGDLAFIVKLLMKTNCLDFSLLSAEDAARVQYLESEGIIIL